MLYHWKKKSKGRQGYYWEFTPMEGFPLKTKSMATFLYFECNLMSFMAFNTEKKLCDDRTTPFLLSWLVDQL
eukprot:m.104295 g.104295  ORF g.104295 m.104295 type:complete len:72 (-) comp13840_c0_seq3:2244-2459(-)